MFENIEEDMKTFLNISLYVSSDNYSSFNKKRIKFW